MASALHLLGLIAMIGGGCCLLADRTHRSKSGVVAAVVMIAAMIDVSRERPLLAPIFWAAVLIACAVAVTVVASRNSSRSERSIRTLVADGALGCLSMVPMVALMGSDLHEATVNTLGSHHGGIGSGPAALLLLLPAIYGAVTLVRAHRGGWATRAQHITMGSGTLLMTAAMLL